MKITNKSNQKIIYRVDEGEFALESKQFIEIADDKFQKISFKSQMGSFAILEARDSKLLKFLSSFDDPFKLLKEYHLIIDCVFEREQICNFQEIEIFTEQVYVAYEIRTYYDYINVQCGGHRISPMMVTVCNQESILDEFLNNNKKLNKWLSIWNVFIEPLILELGGYFAVYCVFSIWLGMNAIWLVLALLVPNILIEFLIMLFKRKKTIQQEKQFRSLLLSKNIIDVCYN